MVAGALCVATCTTCVQEPFYVRKKKGVRPLELLQTVGYRQLGATAWMPGIEPVFSARAVSALNS